MQRLAERVAGHEPEQRGQVRGERSLDVARGVQLVGQTASREQVIPGRPELAGARLGPLVVADPRRRRRRLGGAGRITDGGQVQHDRAGAGQIVVEGDHRPAVVDGHLRHRPAGQR